MNPLFVTALLAGLAGGLHCASMCAAYQNAVARPGAVQPLRPRRELAGRLALLHAGRLSSYAALGGLAGWGGQALLGLDTLALQRAVAVVANGALLLLALALASGRPLASFMERPGLLIYRGLQPGAARIAARVGRGGPWVIGLMWGLLPCGLIYAVLPVAMFAGSALDGALVMFAFGLGTLPNVMLAGALLSRFVARARSAIARHAVAALIAGMALVGLYRAFGSEFPLAQGAFCLPF